MSKRKDVDLIRDIIESMERVISYRDGILYKEFTQDYKTQDAIIRNIEIMGEAVKSLSEKVKKENSDIPWKNIAATRDKLIHDYFGVNLDIVWNIIKKEMPELLPKIKRILRSMTETRK